MEKRKIFKQIDDFSVISSSNKIREQKENKDKNNCNNEIIKIRDFSDYKITTMTIIITFNKYINLDIAYTLLNYARRNPEWVNLEQSILSTTNINNNGDTKKKKKKIPHYGKPGSIISMRYKGYHRGLKIENIDKRFKNSIMIEISTEESNLSFKLSDDNIHMTGATSSNQAIEGGSYIVDQLNYIQEMLDYIQNNQKEAQEAFLWLKENTKGDIIEQESSVTIELDETSESETYINISGITESEDCTESIVSYTLPYDKERESSYGLKLPSGIEISTDENGIQQFVIHSNAIPKMINKEIVIFFLRQYWEFLYHSDYCSELEWILSIKKIYDDFPANRSNPNFIPNESLSENQIIRDDKSDQFNIKSNSGELGDSSYIELDNMRNSAGDIGSPRSVPHDCGESPKGVLGSIVEPLWEPIIDTICLDEIHKVMVNYSLNLGFPVDRFKLAKHLSNLNGFITKFDNQFHPNVSARLPYQIGEGIRFKNRKTIPTVSLMIHRSGSVMLTGPNESICEWAYYLFMKSINAIKDKIVSPYPCPTNASKNYCTDLIEDDLDQLTLDDE